MQSMQLVQQPYFYACIYFLFHFFCRASATVINTAISPVYVTFTEAESDTPSAPTAVDEVIVRVVAPDAGETSAIVPSASEYSDGFYIETASWCDEDGNALDSTVTFEAGETYYINVVVVADNGYFFKQSSDGTIFDAEGGVLKSSGATNFTDSEGVLCSEAYMIIAVEAESATSTSMFGVLISDTEGNGNTGGGYLMAYPGLEGSPSRTTASNNFVEDGSDVSLTAVADTGYTFKGWYQGEPDPAEGGMRYVGEPLTTSATYAFTAPIGLLRPYICAVFEEDTTTSHQANEIQVWIGNAAGNEPGDSFTGGKVAVSYTPSYDDYPEDVVAKDGTEFVHGPIFGCYVGDKVTLYAQPDEGYRFVGWYLADGEWPKNGSEKYTGDMLSDQTTYTFEFTGTNRLICAVFEEISTNTYTVSFDPGTGTGSMASVTVNEGEDYTLPDCTFTHSNSERTFYKWVVPMSDGSYFKDPGDTITVSADTTITATWQYTSSTIIDNSVDSSTSTVVGHLILRDTRTGTVREEDISEETAASAFTEPSNATVNALIAEAKESLSQAAQSYAGDSTVTTVSETVSYPKIINTIDNRVFTDLGYGRDIDGDLSLLRTVTGTYQHDWQYTVTLEAEYESGEELPVIPNVSLTFTPPAVGTTITVTDYESDMKPVLALPEGEARYTGWGGYPEWTLDEEDDGEKTFTIEAGQTYTVWMELMPADGYRFDANETSVSVKNATVENWKIYESGLMGIALSFKPVIPPVTAYTVKFNANGGTGRMENVIVNAGDKLKLPACGFTPQPGKEFDKWDKGPVGSSITVVGNTVLTAIWKDKWTTPETPAQPETPTAAPTDPSRSSDDISPEKPASSAQVEKVILTQQNDNDPKGSTFSLLQAKGVAASKTSIKLTWKKVKGAAQYVIYGNKCGKNNRYVKIKTVSGNTFTQKKLKKGTYYKYLIVAVNGNKALATSKTIHVATKGGKVGNNTGVKLSKTSLSLKVKKSKTIKAALKKGSLKVKTHRKVAWESSNISIAKVSSKGKITAVKKGTCYIYAYAQNGVCAKIKVTVK